MTEPRCTYVMGGCNLPVCPHESHTLWECGASLFAHVHNLRSTGYDHKFQPPKEPADA